MPAVTLARRRSSESAHQSRYTKAVTPVTQVIRIGTPKPRPASGIGGGVPQEEALAPSGSKGRVAPPLGASKVPERGSFVYHSTPSEASARPELAADLAEAATEVARQCAMTKARR